MVPFRCSPVPLCVAPLQTEVSMIGRQGRNVCRDPKYPSVRCFRVVREDTGVPGAVATCGWMAADEAVGCTRAFLTMGWSSLRLICRGPTEPGPRVNDISQIHWSQYLLTTQSVMPN
ncbi:uncharacterized protein TNCV_3785611 [Trichonephila clavipes]|nr:uncharacterized protein TNCV_3785611 [Trichonephila clavipes]